MVKTFCKVLCDLITLIDSNLFNFTDIPQEDKAGKKGYTCQYCGKFFLMPSHLRLHMRVHTGEKPYTCDVCGKGFTQKGNMKSHKLIHIKEQIQF